MSQQKVLLILIGRCREEETNAVEKEFYDAVGFMVENSAELTKENLFDFYASNEQNVSKPFMFEILTHFYEMFQYIFD